MSRYRLRGGNRALEHILTRYPPSAHTSHLIECVPILASLLRDQATEIAQSLYVRTGLASRLFRKLSVKFVLLAECILDLMLVAGSGEACKYCGDNDLASLFVDAVLYQATGCIGTTPTESQVRFTGTQRVRGLSKYVLGRQLLKVGGDVEGWMFGAEYSILLTGSRNISHNLSVQPTTLLIRFRGKWATNYCLYGTLPSEADHEALRSLVESSRKGLTQIAERLKPGKEK